MSRDLAFNTAKCLILHLKNWDLRVLRLRACLLSLPDGALATASRVGCLMTVRFLQRHSSPVCLMTVRLLQRYRSHVASGLGVCYSVNLQLVGVGHSR
jgi:hypothetical protein